MLSCFEVILPNPHPIENPAVIKKKFQRKQLNDRAKLKTIETELSVDLKWKRNHRGLVSVCVCVCVCVQGRMAGGGMAVICLFALKSIPCFLLSILQVASFPRPPWQLALARLGQWEAMARNYRAGEKNIHVTLLPLSASLASGCDCVPLVDSTPSRPISSMVPPLPGWFLFWPVVLVVSLWSQQLVLKSLQS